ncbi:glutamine-synthetase adenylyltransferase [Jannaschia sp. 2305UL9-9]|uniref:[protein-PII] uridylyltransferase family protein n=1 Tax=Jannaschia sp. 2305UL9-9 TaxID=3121638 RepID=UPI003528EF10
MFLDHISQSPIPFDASCAAEALDRLNPPANARDLVAGTAGCSPFLMAAMTREAEWLSGIWTQRAEDSFDRILQDLDAVAGDPKQALRQAKRRVAVLVALAELGGVWPVLTATAHLTRFADAALSKSLAHALARYGKGLPGPWAGLVAIAMGKMGAGELNYSSDIDLVLLFDEQQHDPDAYGEVRAKLLKAARLAMSLMSDITSDGYVFRTDLRLRPDPGSTPIVMSMEAAERYYEAMGRTWERAAWIKARAAAGDIAAGERFLERLTPFVWRRHLDYAVVQDAHDMRLRIRDHKKLAGPWDVPGHHVKLGQGGIREIEFFTQTHQIISGGRDPSLRHKCTLIGLDRLVDAGWVKPGDRDVLAREYVYLRSVEHRLQMVQDAQTHHIPSDAAGLQRLANFMGQGDVDAFVNDLRDRMRAVEAITDPRFKPREADVPTAEIAGADDITERWETYPALRSGRARGIFARLRPSILNALSRATRPEEALAAFDAFLRGLPAGVQILSLFDANPSLVDLTADICAIAPDLAVYLSKNAAVFDAVIAGDFISPLPDRYEAPDLDGLDFEMALARVRAWHREAHFRIGVHLLRRLATPQEAGAAYARLAEATLDACWRVSEAEAARRYGRVPGMQLAVLGMGSLGAGRLTARSDLDLVVLHDGAPMDALSDGRRALAPSQWAAKATQVLITALTAPMGDGRLYEVDMRLRPSGKQGPVATSLDAFRSYQATEAWVWEHMALTRARALTGDAETMALAEEARCAILARGRYDRSEVLTELAGMRQRLRDAGRRGHGLAVKSGPGRMQDIELAAQAHALIARADARDVRAQLGVAGWLTAEERACLSDAYDLLARAQQVLRLLSDGDPPGELGTGAEAFLSTSLEQDSADAVAAAMDVAAEQAAVVIDGALARGIGQG